VIWSKMKTKKSDPLVNGKLYELKVLIDGELHPAPADGGHFVRMWRKCSAPQGEGLRMGIKREELIGNYHMNDGPFLVVDRCQNSDVYQILTPDEKVGWVYFGSWIRQQFYFCELSNCKESE